MKTLTPTESERFAGRILSLLSDEARVKYTGPDEDGVMLVLSERATGINFTITVSTETDDDELTSANRREERRHDASP